MRKLKVVISSDPDANPDRSCTVSQTWEGNFSDGGLQQILVELQARWPTMRAESFTEVYIRIDEDVLSEAMELVELVDTLITEQLTALH